MNTYHGNRTGRFFLLKPRYVGSYVAMVYGLFVAVSGHVWCRPTTASVGELVLYGGLLYHARKRQRFQTQNKWLALEVYAGLSVVWMAVNIIRTQVWQWHPLAFGLTPLVVIGAYLVALIGTPYLEVKPHTALTSGFSTRHIPIIIATAAVWAILNIYVFPKMQIRT